MDCFTVIGISTLLSKRSAMRTCPNLQNFRYGKLYGHARIFSNVTTGKDHYAKDDTAIASCALCEHPDYSILISIFDVPLAEWDAFLAREFDYDLRQVAFTEENGEVGGIGFACYETTDERTNEIAQSCPIRGEALRKHRQKYKGPQWRDDITPCEVYLARALRAVKEAGPEFEEDYLKSSLLADRKTTLGEYLKAGAD